MRPAVFVVSAARAQVADPVGAATWALAVRDEEQRTWLVAIAAGLDAQRVRQSVPVRRSAPPTVLVAMDTVAVRQCIKDHESGNYAESSHPGAGSGAYQYTPGTFRTWFDRWAAATGYDGPTYAYAYNAPPDVQDALTDYVLTNGGAGNWSMRWGDDPCTAGLPGGG